MSKEWRAVRIGDWGEVKGGRQRSAKVTRGNKRPYLRVANVFDGYIDTSDVLEMPFTDKEFTQYALRPGDILLNEGQSLELVGRSALYEGEPDKYAFQNTLIRFRAGPECDPRFARALFRVLWQRNVFRGIAKKTTSIAHLGMRRFADLIVQVPPLRIQRYVSRHLSKFDRAITAVDQLVASKLELKRGLMGELLTGKRRFPEFGAPMRTGLPVGWRNVRLSDVTEELSLRNDGGLSAERVMGVIKEVGLEPMRDHVRGADLSRYKVVPPDGFAYNPMRLNIGSIARSQFDENCLVSPDYVVFTPAADKLLPAYLDHLRRSALWSAFVRRAGAGSVRVRIYYRDLSNMRIPLPAIVEQARIAAALDAAGREIALLRSMRQALTEQKRGLMEKLLSGRIETPDEPVETESGVA